jgi:hypothetical protein
MQQYDLGFGVPQDQWEIDELLPYDAGRLVYEAETERMFLEKTLRPESFLSLHEKAVISQIEGERQLLLDKGLETEASVSEYYIGKYLKRGEERKSNYIEWVINEKYNPYPDIFLHMPSQKEIEEMQMQEFSYRFWDDPEGAEWDTETLDEMYMKLSGEETLH